MKRVIEGKVEGRCDGARGRMSKQLLDDLMETRGYWNLKQEALDRALWRTDFGRDCGPDPKREGGMNKCQSFTRSDWEGPLQTSDRVVTFPIMLPAA